MKLVAVIGFKGMVGSGIFKAFEKDSKFKVVGVERENYEQLKQGEYDVLINCAMPSGKFWANKNPELDFKETVEKTANLVYGWKFNKFVQISTVSARCQLDTVYGRHKAAAEHICNFNSNLIVRLGAIYDVSNSKGVLVDMLAGKTVFASGSSRFSFISLDFCINWIKENFEKAGVVELGGKNSVTLQSVADNLGVAVKFEGPEQNLDIENNTYNLPEASEVYNFVNNLKKHG